MSSVVIAGNTSGSITLQAPAVSGSTVLTLPTTSATLITDSSGILNIGSGQLYKDTSGNVGIGTSSPTGKLSITQSTAGATALAVNGVAARQFIDYAGGGGSYFDGAQTYFRTFGGTNCAILSASTNSTLQLTSSTGYSLLSITSATGSSAYLDFAVNNVQTARLFSDSNSMLAFATGSAGSERMRIDSTGNVGIGTSSPAQKLHISSSVSGSQLQLTYPSVRNYTIGATSDYALAFRDADANAERMRIDSSGNLLVGTTSSNPIASRVTGYSIGPTFATFNGATSGMAIGIKATSGTNIVFYTDNGSAYVTAGNISSTGSATAYGVGTSDYRAKENVKNLVDGLKTIDSMRPVSFTWKNSKENDIGFIAHEIQSIIPSTVHGEKDAVDEDGKPKMQTIFPAPPQMIANLVKAIQELKAIIDTQQEQINSLLGK